MKWWCRAALALTLATVVPAATLRESVERLIAASPVARAAFWGIQIVDLSTGRTLYEQNASHFFLPASNAKLFTTALALSRLGADFTFTTRVVAEVPPDADGTLHGSLRLVGGGDPNLSARAIPYRPGPATGDPLAALEELADQVAAHGVKRVEGDVVGDDTWYLWQPYSPGWSIDDPLSDDGPPISALTINDNVFSLSIRPGAVLGDPAGISLHPPVEFYRLDNRVRTTPAGSERRIHVERIPGSRDLRIWGTAPLRDHGQDLLLGIDDPAEYAAMAFRQALERRGIVVTGATLARHQFPNEVTDLFQAPAPGPDLSTVLAQRVSAPLLEDLRITDKVSQNLHAELALRSVGKAKHGIGSSEAGREELRTFLGEAGIDAGSYNLVDGSGLSRLDLVTPAAVVKLLRHMFASTARQNWISLLPVAGVDGTLGSRFAESRAAGHVYAKTGSLSHVSALSGYVHRKNGTWVAFSILVNNYFGATAEVRGVMDGICALIME